MEFKATSQGVNFATLRKRIEITPARLKAWAAVSLNSLQERLSDGKNLQDQAMKPYSKRGPIYVPVTGYLAGRTQDVLKGRSTLTRSDVRKARQQGWEGGLTHSRKTMKFENYQAYKQFLGKSGKRDLEVTGAMRRSIGIVAQTAHSITIGFLSETERKKMVGNNRIDPAFGLSPLDLQTLYDFVSSELQR